MDEENSNSSSIWMYDESIDAIGIDKVNIEEISSTPSICLIINQEYQQQLEEFISSIEDKLEENREKQQYLKAKIKHDKKPSTKENSYLNFITPYFRDHKGLHPPPNEDTKQKQLNGELNQNYAITVKKWTHIDENHLFNNIKEFYVKDQVEQSRAKLNRLHIELKISESNKFECERLEEEIERCNFEIKKLINSGTISMVNDLQDKIDWLYVSKSMDDVYDNLNCKLYWINYLHPQVNKSEWTTDEIDRLGELTKDQEFFNWERIAEQLKTGRKAWQVAKQYQITFNSNIKHNGPFTEEEIKNLTTVIDRCQIGDYIPWNQVYYFIDGRSTFQLKQFWDKHLRGSEHKLYWTLLEDTILQLGYIKYRGDWKKIAFYLPDRSNRQCRERYVNRLGIIHRRYGNWTIGEDKELKACINEHGTDFKKITNLLEGRSENQVKSRYKVLVKTKEKGENLSYKRNKAFELESIRVNYLEEKVNKIKNVDLFLTNSREILIGGIDRDATKKEDLEKLKTRLSIRNLSRLENEEKRVDDEIMKMFEDYNLIPNKFQPKPNSTSSDNLFFNEALVNHLDCLMKSQNSSHNNLLSNVIEYLFKTEITDLSSNSKDPPILPPNRTTMLAFFGILIQKDNLGRIAIKDESQQNFDPSQLKNDPEYKRLKQIFTSLFLLPAILTDTQLPAPSNKPNDTDQTNIEKEIQNGESFDENNSMDQIEPNVRKSKKRKNSLAARHERQVKAKYITRIRQVQKVLVDSYVKWKRENTNMPIDRDNQNVNDINVFDVEMS